MQRGANILLIEAVCIAGMSALLFGPINTTFLKLLGASPLHFGLATAAVQAGVLSQLFTHYFIEKLGSIKRVCVGAFAGARLIRLAFFLVPLLLAVTSKGAVVWAFIALSAAMSLFAQVGLIGRLSLISELVDENRRGAFFAARNRTVIGISAVIMLAASWVMDAWLAGHPDRPYVIFQILFAGSGLVGLGSLVCLMLVPNPPFVRDAAHGPVLAVRRAFGSRRFRRFMVLRSAWGFSSFMAASFFVYYMIYDLGMKGSAVALLLLLARFLIFYTSGFWGRLMDKFGCKPIILFGVVGLGVYPLLWVFVNPATVYLIPILFLMQALTPASTLGMVTLEMKLAPPQGRAAFLSTARVVFAVSKLLGPLFGGGVGWGLAGVRVPLGPVTLNNFHLLFIVAAAFRLACLIPLAGIREPRTRTAGEVVRILGRSEGFNPAKHFGGFITFWFAPVISAGRGMRDGTRVVAQAVRDRLEPTSEDDDETDPQDDA